MKKLVLPLLLALSLLLGGCGKQNAARYESFAGELRERSDLELTAELRAEYDDRSMSFTLRYTDEPDGGCCVEVLEPEIIRGVKARLSAEGASLGFESVSVDTGDDGGTGLSPMGALPLLVRALRSAPLDSAWTEEGRLAVRLIPEDGIELCVLFDADMKPDYAEISHEGKTVLFADITSFS